MVCILGNGDCFVPTESIDIRDTTYDKSKNEQVKINCSGNCMYLVEVYINVDLNISTNPSSKLVLSGKTLDNQGYDSSWDIDFFRDTTNERYKDNILLAKGMLLHVGTKQKPVPFTKSSEWFLFINIGNGEPPIVINRFVIKAISYKNDYINLTTSIIKLPLKNDITMKLTIGPDEYIVSRKAEYIVPEKTVISDPVYANKVSTTEVETSVVTNSFSGPILIIILLLIITSLGFFFYKKKKMSAMSAFGKKLHKISKGF